MRRFRFIAGVTSAVWLAAAQAAAEAPSARAPAEPPLVLEEWSPALEARRAPHHARSLLEMGTGLGLGLGGYWVFKDDNVTDWDNPRLRQRFDGAAWTLDNNSIGVNFLGHPLEGALAYNFARANHQSAAGAFAYSFLTSFIWEFVVEFKEKVSLNDVVTTPGAGLPLGEFFYKLGLYLDTGHRGSVPVGVLRSVLGTGVALDRGLDGRPPPHVTKFDALGFSPEIWHQFEARYGAATVSSPREPSYARLHAGVAATLVTLPGYGRAQRFGRAFYGAELSSLLLQAEGSRYGWGLALSADTSLLGYHAQTLQRVGASLSGEMVTLGTSLGYDYLRSEANRYDSMERAVALPQPDLDYHVPNRREQYGALQLPGLACDLKLLRGWGGIDLRARVQPSFAGLGAAAFYDWAAANLDERGKHILHRQGYFYGWGGAVSALARLRLGPLRGDFELFYGGYRSQNGLDRKLDEVTDDVTATGSLLRYRGALGIAPGSGATSISLELGAQRFESKVGGFERTLRGAFRGVSARFVF